MLTIPDRRFHDKMERDEHVNLEKWWTYACESRRRHLRSRRAPWGLPKLFPSDAKILLLFAHFSEGKEGKRVSGCVIDEIDVTVPGIERWRTVFAVSRHPFSSFPQNNPPSQIDSCYSQCVGKSNVVEMLITITGQLMMEIKTFELIITIVKMWLTFFSVDRKLIFLKYIWNILCYRK